ncbi:MAG: hypothetical protein ACXWQO_13485 [Bdellovibrionota bacterium]
MMDGTKPYRRKNSPSPESSTIKSDPAESISPRETTPDAVNLDRRKWFGSIIPAFGDGLVKLLRASNNLKDDLAELHRSSSETNDAKP